MNAFLLGILSSIVGGLVAAGFGEILSQEIRDRLDHLPHAILRLAARRLCPAQRASIYEDEWMPELTFILKGDEARPITRLYHGTRYAVGILATAPCIASRLGLAAPYARGDYLAFDRIVPSVTLMNDIQYACLSNILHRLIVVDHKSLLLAGVERRMREMQMYVDALSQMMSQADLTRRQKREISEQRDSTRHLIQLFAYVREDIAANFGQRLGGAE